MTTATRSEPRTNSHQVDICNALQRIPPLWPLDHFVAVNPFVGMTSMTITEAAKVLQASHGVMPFQLPSEYLSAWQDGKISSTALEEVSDETWTVDRLVDILKKTGESDKGDPITTVADLFDRKKVHAHWNRFITDEISKWCAVTFDENQTTWNSPWKSEGLFTGWLQAARYDRNPEAYGLTGFRAFIATLPEDSTKAIDHCIAILKPAEVPLTDFLHRQLATISGWAGYVRYLVREDELREIANPALHDLLAIRLAYDAALLKSVPIDSDLLSAWRNLPARNSNSPLTEALVRWQDAYESDYGAQLVRDISAQHSTRPETRPSAQAIFCIDVRSEVFRRHLEATRAEIQTIGFAGFFGFPVAHRAANSLSRETSRCPALLVPPVASKDTLSDTEESAARLRLSEAGVWKAFQNSAASCFSFVESAGLAFGAVLGRAKKKKENGCDSPPSLVDVPAVTQADLAEGALRNMSLSSNFARLVLICGHGSHSSNNPYASSLDCGACGGHAGDLNARLAASVLNDSGVRKILTGRGISIPEDSVFIAGLHDTLCDEVTLFNPENVPATHTDDLADLKEALEKAGHFSRLERAPGLGLAGIEEKRLAGFIRKRGTDISQVRPEWGLAGNTAIVVAPRSRTAGLKLDGRVFLHDYHAADDPEDKVLNLILAAPVVVASWINLQYYASRISPDHFGSGDKTLHHVAGGIGVMEGNQGDLKVGLPLQSIHNGNDFVHEARRLTVIIEATRQRLDDALQANSGVRELFDHGWIHLVALEGNDSYRRTDSEWVLRS